MSNRELVVLGTASQVPTRRRNHNGYFLRWDGEGLLFDPGEGTQRQMQFAGVTASHISRICITHFHGDHCLGLPGVLQRMSLDEVTHEVEVCYPASGREVFGHLRRAAIYRDSVTLLERPVVVDGMVGNDVPAGPAGLAGVDGPGWVIGNGAPGAGQADGGARGFRLEARQLSHTVPTVGYALIETDGRRMLPDKLAAAGVAGPDIGRLQRDGRLIVSGRPVMLEQVSEPRSGQRFAFIMDTRLCDAAFELAENADMLVCECTFADADAALAREYGHLTAGEAGRIAAESGARSLVLTHFSQRYDEEATDRLGAEAATAFGGEIVLARDFDRIAVPRRRESTPWSEHRAS
ncbi:MAG: ribonuclease Z [Streptosporangiaceae bacterium]